MKVAAVAALIGTALAAAPALAQTAPVNPPIVAPLLVPPAPPITNATSSRLFNAMLAISRAQQTNPEGAQNAAFAYAKALERYRAGDLSGADFNAINAMTLAAQNSTLRPQPVPSPVFATPRLPQTALYGGDAPAIDADAFLALTRNQINDCAARKAPGLAQAQSHYAAAERAFAARNYQSVRLEAKAAIDSCAR